MPAPIPPTSAFTESYPEFLKAPLSLVEAKLGEAARRTADIYHDAATLQDAVMLRAAYLLSVSPFAMRMKLVDQEMSNQWKRQLYEMQRSAVSGWRVFSLLLAFTPALAAFFNYAV